jgi:two-component system chemotaxis response regulator CheY
MSGRDLHILIVEDSPTMRHLLALAVERRSAQVAEASDGLAALKLLAQQRFDLMFVDLNMPILDGMKLIKRVREDATLTATTQICVVTTEGAHATEEQARALGAQYFLRKPVHRRDIEQVLAQAFPG